MASKNAGISSFSAQHFFENLDPSRLAPCPSLWNLWLPQNLLHNLRLCLRWNDLHRKVDFGCQGNGRLINQATTWDPWNMRLGSFVTSDSFKAADPFKAAAQEYAQQQEKNKDRAAQPQQGRWQVGRVSKASSGKSPRCSLWDILFRGSAKHFQNIISTMSVGPTLDTTCMQ